MIAIVAEELKKRLDERALASLPYEACGLLLGYKSTDEIHVEDCVFTRNVSTGDKTRTFEIDPQAHIDLQRRVREAGTHIIGVWHSHPNGVAEISETDRAMSAEKDWLWLISAVSEDRAETSGFVSAHNDSHHFYTVKLA